MKRTAFFFWTVFLFSHFASALSVTFDRAQYDIITTGSPPFGEVTGEIFVDVTGSSNVLLEVAMTTGGFASNVDQLYIEITSPVVGIADLWLNGSRQGPAPLVFNINENTVYSMRFVYSSPIPEPVGEYSGTVTLTVLGP